MPYPWSTGDELTAPDLNAAIAQYAPPPGSGGYLPLRGGPLLINAANDAAAAAAGVGIGGLYRNGSVVMQRVV